MGLRERRRSVGKLGKFYLEPDISVCISLGQVKRGVGSSCLVYCERKKNIGVNKKDYQKTEKCRENRLGCLRVTPGIRSRRSQYQAIQPKSKQICAEESF
ncbi:hypothetical protein ElyMa_003098800 [Elysia marginata]|uniref:Uncharacterized protein n=1 Tax=Elysia marginata TaxID=1093978 RepID=A0AAV4IRN8_9GAST|nr:hypothetical protein ElyMa_003098800 [Elysia marginata]